MHIRASIHADQQNAPSAYVLLLAVCFAFVSTASSQPTPQPLTANQATTASATKSEDDDTTVSDKDKPSTAPWTREWGDTSIPPERKETFFQDEFVRKPRKGQAPTTHPLTIPPKFNMPKKPVAK